jgi:AraC family transcriptional regulator
MSAAVWWGGAMGVGSLLSDGSESDHSRQDVIEILIPGERAAVSIVYRTEGGHERSAFVRVPMVSVIPPGEDCRVQCQRPAETLVLQMSLDYFREKAGAVLGAEVPGLVVRYACLDPFIREVGKALQDQLRHDPLPNAAFLEPLAAVMAVHLARYYGATACNVASPAGLAHHKLKQVQSFVDEHIAESVHVGRLAAAVHMSPFHFAHMFKVTTGQPPHMYVMIQRVERAKSLLSESELPLIDVAVQSGFRTQGHFTGVFRRYTGFTPRAFRLNRRDEQPL